MIGFLKRSGDVVDAIGALMKRGNVFIAEAVFRFQIDNILYLNYCLTLGPRAQEDFCRLLAGEPRMRSLEHPKGCALSDRRLLDLAQTRIPEIREWYQLASSAVHFSHHLVFSYLKHHAKEHATLFVGRGEHFDDEQTECLFLVTMFATVHLHWMVKEWCAAHSVARNA